MDSKVLCLISSGKAASQPPPLHPALSRPGALTMSMPSSDKECKPSSAPLEEAVHSPPFAPYLAQVPWHTGFRAFLSQLFPRYGHYCGPNWSSGRSSGSLFWDKPPLDGLDYCCFCHDVGYDSHDQAQLYKADLEFLECLQKLPPPNARHRHAHALSHASHPQSNAAVAGLHRNLYITGLQNFLIPYRRLLLRNMGARKE